MNICPYCGFEFEETHEFCHSSCPMGKHCFMVMCPNCRYEYLPTKSRIVDFFKKIFSSRTPSQTRRSMQESQTSK